MDIRIHLSLPNDVALSLKEWAIREKRDPRQQAAWIIEQVLKRQGFLTFAELNETSSTDDNFIEVKHEN